MFNVVGLVQPLLTGDFFNNLSQSTTLTQDQRWVTYLIVHYFIYRSPIIRLIFNDCTQLSTCISLSEMDDIILRAVTYSFCRHWRYIRHLRS